MKYLVTKTLNSLNCGLIPSPWSGLKLLRVYCNQLNMGLKSPRCNPITINQILTNKSFILWNAHSSFEKPFPGSFFKTVLTETSCLYSLAFPYSGSCKVLQCCNVLNKIYGETPPCKPCHYLPKKNLLSLRKCREGYCVTHIRSRTTNSGPHGKTLFSLFNRVLFSICRNTLPQIQA